MRIGLVTDTYLPDINGVVSSTVTLKRALEKRGDTVFIITNHAGAHIEMEDGILRLPGVKLKGLYGYKMSSPVNPGVARYIKEMDLDVVHLQTNFGVGLYGQYLARSLSIPVVNTYHTMYEDYTHYINPLNFSGLEKISRDAIRAASRRVCNSVQAVIAPSEKTRETLIQYGVIAPIHVVPTGLDLQAFSNAQADRQRLQEIRSRVSEDPQDRILVFIGRIAKEKSLEIPIEAIASSKDSHLHLAIVGAGPDEDFYHRLCEELHVEDRVHFLGKAQPEEVCWYYAAFDAFVSASLSETQGMTYLEAMATGSMVFGRRDEVLDGLLEEGKTGYYFDTPEELLEKAEQFYQLDEAQRAENADACRRRIEPYTDESFAKSAHEVYEQAIADYSHTFEVKKISIDADYAFLTLARDASKEPVRVMLPIEEYFEHKISLNSKIDAYMVSAWMDLQPFYTSMYRVKKRLAQKEMTSWQVQTYCTQKLGVPANVAKEVAEELAAERRIDDHQYALDKSEYFHSIGNTRAQIEKKLYQAGIAREYIEEAMAGLDEDVEMRNARRMAARLVRTLKTQSARRKRQTIAGKLRARGFSSEAVDQAFDGLELEDDSDALQAAVAKAARMYARLDEKTARSKIMTYCLRQGFERGEIEEAMQESEMNHD